MKKRFMSTLLTVTVMASALTACVPKAANETAAPAAITVTVSSVLINL